MGVKVVRPSGRKDWYIQKEAVAQGFQGGIIPGRLPPIPAAIMEGFPPSTPSPLAR